MNLILVIGKDSDGQLLGNTSYKDHLIVVEGDSVKELYKRAITQINNLISIASTEDKVITLSIAYDLPTFFDQFKVLNASRLADLARIKPTLLREFIMGSKRPSKKESQQLQEAVYTLADELGKTAIYMTP